MFAAYPAPGLLVGDGFHGPPRRARRVALVGCLVASGGLALRFAGVRDWRVYAAALMVPPVVDALFYGAVDSC